MTLDHEGLQRDAAVWQPEVAVHDGPLHVVDRIVVPVDPEGLKDPFQRSQSTQR